MGSEWGELDAPCKQSENYQSPSITPLLVFEQCFRCSGEISSEWVNAKMEAVYTYPSSVSAKLITLCFIDWPVQSQLYQGSLRHKFSTVDESDVSM